MEENLTPSNNEAFKHRRNLSEPIRWAQEAGLITGKVLDYECGWGRDADILDMHKFDSVHHPEQPKGRYDIVFSIFSLDRERRSRIDETIRRLQKLLRNDGTVYLVVCRNTKGEALPVIRLDLPVVYEQPWYAVYRLDAGDAQFDYLTN